jgi:hypothetical protein
VSWKIENEVDVMQAKLYKNCYMGHLGDEWWQKLAEFVLAEVKAAYSEGFDAGRQENDTHGR